MSIWVLEKLPAEFLVQKNFDSIKDTNKCLYRPDYGEDELNFIFHSEGNNIHFDRPKIFAVEDFIIIDDLF